MLQLLLVDDERSVVETLAETIPWESCGIGTVHEALSGAVALEIMENHDIDIVITDIRMPEMSGIELITAIHEKWSHVQTILPRAMLTSNTPNKRWLRKALIIC